MFFVISLEYVLLFLDDTVNKEMNNFQIARVQPRDVALSLCCFLFCQFQPCVAYKSVAYKESMYGLWKYHKNCCRSKQISKIPPEGIIMVLAVIYNNKSYNRKLLNTVFMG